jgi:O-antigen/teichoic acid export membrane protein
MKPTGTKTRRSSGDPRPLGLRALRAALSPETRGLARDSFILSIGSVVATAGQMAQIALITHFLGLGDYGVLALTISVVAIVSRFFDVQVGNAAIAFATRTRNDPHATAGIFRFSYLVDAAAGVAGYAVVAALTPFVAHRLAGPQGRLLFLLYALTLLTSTVETTSLALLQFLRRFGSILALTVVRELLRVALLVSFLILFDSLKSAVIALIIVEGVFSVTALLSSGAALRKRYGQARLLRRAPAVDRATRRSMFAMILHTNFIAYAKLVSSQLPTILLGVFRSPVEVGAFKVAMALAAGVGKPADPAWAAVLPRLSRLWNEGRLAEARALVAESTALAFAILISGAALVVVLRDDLIKLLAGQTSSTAIDVLLLALIAQVLSGTLFWNSALLVAARRAGLASRSYVASALLLVILLPILTRAFGASGAAVALLASTITGNALLTLAAIRLLQTDVVPRSKAENVQET